MGCRSNIGDNISREMTKVASVTTITQSPETQTNNTVLHTNYCTFPTEHCFLYRVKRNRERLVQPEVVEPHYQLSEKLT